MNRPLFLVFYLYLFILRKLKIFMYYFRWVKALFSLFWELVSVHFSGDQNNVENINNWNIHFDIVQLNSDIHKSGFSIAKCTLYNMGKTENETFRLANKANLENLTFFVE